MKAEGTGGEREDDFIRITLMYYEFFLWVNLLLLYVVCFHATDKDIFGYFIVIKPYPKRCDMRQPDNLRNKIFIYSFK
jgi:hypothetical protein